MAHRKWQIESRGGCVAALLVCGVLCRDAAAAPPPPVEIEDIAWGFADRLEAERWTPVTLWLSGPSGAFGGVMSVEHRQDATQSARIMVPFATTPGAIVPVEVLLCVPTDCDRITFSFSDGDRDRKIEFSSLPGLRDRPMPEVETVRRTVVLLGAPTAADAFTDSPLAAAPAGTTTAAPTPPALSGAAEAAPSGAGEGNEADDDRTDEEKAVEELLGDGAIEKTVTVQPWNQSGVQLLGPPNSPEEAKAAAPRWSMYTPIRPGTGSMPLSWMAYDGVEVVVTSAELGLDPRYPCDARALEALIEWTKAGGRLVVVAEQAGDAWMRFALIAGETMPVRAADSMDVAPGPEIAHVLKAAAKKSSNVTEAVSTARGRSFTLTEAGARRGWRVRWRADDPLSTGEVGASGLLAEGPLGFGMVTLLGVEPTKVHQFVSTDATRAVWRDALLPALAGRPGRGPESDRNAAYRWYGGNFYSGSGIDRETRDAQGVILDRITKAPRLGNGLFFAIAACIGGLALLVGPVDMLGLKRLNARQHSWLTALGWIALASAGAYAMPMLVRSGESSIFRLTQIDAMPGPDGRMVAASTGVTSFFSGRPGQFGVKENADGAWWRGISPLSTNEGGKSNFAALAARQGAFDGGRLRANVLAPIRMGQWTCRALLDRGAFGADEDAALPEAKVYRAGDDWIAEVKPTGGARIHEIALRVGGRTIRLSSDGTIGEGAAAAMRFVGSSEAAPGPAAPARGGSAYRLSDAWDNLSPPETSTYVRTASATNQPGAAFSLPGSRDRTSAIEALCATGTWACLYMQITDLPGDKELVGEAVASREAVVRMMVEVGK